MIMKDDIHAVVMQVADEGGAKAAAGAGNKDCLAGHGLGMMSFILIVSVYPSGTG